VILHPGILALLGGSLLSVLLLIKASGLGLTILLRWDGTSSSEQQLALEHKTWLISSLLNAGLGFQIVSGVLFLATVEAIHPLFVGAMCATGTLNANLVGWLVLLVKGLLFFAAALWVIFNRLDQRSEDAPLLRPKYLALLLITPLAFLDLTLQYSFFSGLHPDIITSCCGSLFSEQGQSVLSELAALPPVTAMALFFPVIAIYYVLTLCCLRSQNALLRYLLFITVIVAFFIALAAIISFISLYLYQMPSHHCPFDLLQAHYNYIGYPLYAGLFGGTLFGLLPGLAAPLQHHPSLFAHIDQLDRHWLWISLIGMTVFLAIALWPMLFAPFTLLRSG